MHQGRVVVYTDGACQGNQFQNLRRAGAGAYWGQDHPFNVSQPLAGEQQTNNRVELLAVLSAFQVELRPMEVRTDSLYVCNSITKHPQRWKNEGWKKKGKLIINADLWQQLGEILEQRDPDSHKITKVKGHAQAADVLAGRVLGTDKHGNDAADALAVAAATRNTGGLEDGQRKEATVSLVVQAHRLMAEVAKTRAQMQPGDGPGEQLPGTSSDSSNSSHKSNRSSISSSSRSSSSGRSTPSSHRHHSSHRRHTHRHSRPPD